MTPKKPARVRILLGFGAGIFLGIAAASGQTYSHARIVRLSFVEGQVTLQRPDFAEWAEAPMNTPLEEGFKLSTAENSFAEVEFENGSTVRLGQFSLLEFTQLGLASDGSKINRLTMDTGYATFHATPEGQEVYEVLTPDARLNPRGKALFRVDVDSTEERVEVFNGFLEAEGSLGSWTLAKNSVLDLSPGADQPAQLSQGITNDDWDRWVKERESEAEAASSNPSSNLYTNNGADTAYGWSDLAYYGNWSYMPGIGYGWIPSVDAGWYPYSLGFWCWYPGFGYTWISAEPWGWLPYHFGYWEFIPGIGWVWFPGSFGAWSPGLVNWYGGPGWIGWTPRHGLPRPRNPFPCSQAQPCGAAISTSAFKHGRPVRPETVLPVNPESGNRMERPDLLPDRQAMLPGRVIATPTEAANAKVSIIGPRSVTPRSQPTNTQPTTAASGSAAGITLILGGSAAGFQPRHAAPGPEPGIAYDPAAGRYVNNSRLPSGATQPSNELAGRQQPLGPGALASRDGQPAPGTQKGEPAPTPQGYGSAWYRHSFPRSDSGSAAAPRSGAPAPNGRAAGDSSSEGSGSTSGAVKGGGGGTGGSAHGGGASASSSHH
jgi:uncharacterized membrane protein YgcG